MASEIDRAGVYGRDDEAFAIGQNKPPGFEQKEPRKSRLSCCLTIFSRRTWAALFYIWIVNPTYAWFCAGFLSAFLYLSGVSLILCCLGVVVFAFTLRISTLFASIDVGFINCLSGESPIRRPRFVSFTDVSGRTWLVEMLTTVQAYKEFLYMWLLKLIIAWPFQMLSVLVIGIALVGVSSPIVYASCDTCLKDGDVCLGSVSYPDDSQTWGEGDCTGWHINTAGDTVALMFLGLLLLFLGLKMTNGMFSASIWITKALLAEDITNPDHRAAQTRLLDHSGSGRGGPITSAPGPQLAGPAPAPASYIADQDVV